MKQLHFKVHIQAPKSLVWDTMLTPDTYRQWTSCFCEGSYYEGSWEKGSTILFLSPSGGGMKAIIAENRPLEHISIRHLACLTLDGEEVFPDPAYENYTFLEAADGTALRVDVDTDEKYEAMFEGMWPRSLAILKDLCEKAASTKP